MYYFTVKYAYYFVISDLAVEPIIQYPHQFNVQSNSITYAFTFIYSSPTIQSSIKYLVSFEFPLSWPQVICDLQ